MLINLRNALMTGKRLPYDAEVEYLESMGTQWIDTGVTMTPGLFDNAETTIEFQPTSYSLSLTMNFFGDGTSFQDGYTFGITTMYTSVQVSTGTKTYQCNTIVPTSDPTLLKVTKQQVLINGGQASIAHTLTSNQSSSGTLLLFGCRRNGTFFTATPFAGRIYSAKMVANGATIFDFIPVRKGTVGYLYDRVSGQLFGNAGTGDFVLGPDKN